MGKAGLELKKEILLALGKTPMIKDGKLYIEPNAWFVPIKNNYPALEAEYQGLEPTETPINKTQQRLQPLFVHAGSRGGIRTHDQLVNSQLRYRCATRE